MSIESLATRPMTPEECKQAEREFHEAYPLHQPIEQLKQTMRAWKWSAVKVYADDRMIDIIPIVPAPTIETEKKEPFTLHKYPPHLVRSKFSIALDADETNMLIRMPPAVFRGDNDIYNYVKISYTAQHVLLDLTDDPNEVEIPFDDFILNLPIGHLDDTPFNVEWKFHDFYVEHRVDEDGMITLTIPPEKATIRPNK